MTVVARLRGLAWHAREAIGRAVTALANRLGLGTFVRLDVPPAWDMRPRYGYGRPSHARLEQLIGAHRDRYGAQLDHIAAYRSDLLAIERDAHGSEPAWINGFFPGLDGASLYTFLRDRDPARYVEIGSGNSTKFAARARRDGGLRTRITSIDPAPRAEVDTLCDSVVRAPLELADLRVFDELERGDVVFFDGSHRTFENSDVTVFFLEILPELAPGVLVGIHDVYLPAGYPPEVLGRHYSEQYLLAAYLLADPDAYAPVLASAFVSADRQLAGRLEGLWRELPGVESHGVAFWLEPRR